MIQYCLDHPDESYVSISKRFGVHDTTIGGWMKSYRKNDNEIVLSKTTAIHLNKDYEQLLNKNIYGYYLHGDVMQKKLLDSKKN